MGKKHLRAGIVLATLLFLLLALTALVSAAAVGREGKSAISYEGISVRYEGRAGIRAVFSANAADIEQLEKSFFVTYGVIAAVGEWEGEVLARPDALAVSGSWEGGFAAKGEHALAVTLYRTGEGLAPWADLGEGKFALALALPESGVAKEEYCFSAFLAVTDKTTGKTSYFYDPATGPLFGSITARHGVGASVAEMAEHLINEYEKDALTAWRYYNSPLLRDAFLAEGGYIRSRAFPVATPGDTPLFDPVPEDVMAYFSDAREAYEDPVTRSLIRRYLGKRNSDRGTEIFLVWEGDGEAEYTVTLTSDAFPAGSITFPVTGTVARLRHLLPGYLYIWDVTQAESGEAAVRSEWFEIGEGPRFITADGARNVRDAGGWNGIVPGILYRGSELNAAEDHGLGLTAEGIAALRELGIRTEIDFRAPADSGGQTASALGEDVTFLQLPIGSYSPLQNKTQYTSVLRILSRWENYPVYLHCWGGADRTGTVVFLLQGIAGVSLADLAVDYELTSFADFGTRSKDDEETYPYAPMLSDILSLEGETAKDKFKTYAFEYLELTRAEVSNLVSILTGRGAVFANGSLWNVEGAAEGFTLHLTLRDSAVLTSLTLEGEALPFTLSEGVLTVRAEDLAALGKWEGILTLTFDDGTVLTTVLAE